MVHLLDLVIHEVKLYLDWMQPLIEKHFDMYVVNHSKVPEVLVN